MQTFESTLTFGKNSWRRPFVLLTTIVLAIAGAGGTYAAYSLYETAANYEQSHVIAQWNFDDDLSTAVIDTSGRNNHGTIKGATRTEGLVNKAMYFDGVDDSIVVAPNQPLLFTAGFAIEFFAAIKPAPKIDGTDIQMILNQENAEPFEIFYVPKLSNIECKARLQNGQKYTVKSEGIPPETWVHVVCSHDQEKLVLFVNGEQVAETEAPGPLQQKTTPIHIGKKSVGAGKFFRGSLDEVTIYDVPLSSRYVSRRAKAVAAIPAQAPQPASSTGSVPNRGKYDPGILYIEMEQKYFDQISAKRDEALETGILMSGSDDLVPASLIYNGKKMPSMIRLKGDWTDHLKGNKWSYRVKLKGDGVFHGISNFSLQAPQVRNYMGEWLWHAAMKQEGIIGLRYFFLPVSINGSKPGIYAIEEHFDAKLLENNKRRASAIIKFNENILWTDRLRRKEQGQKQDYYDERSAYLSSDLDTFDAKAMLEDPVLKDQFVRASELLERYRNGSLSPQKVFDFEKMAKYFALSDVLGAHHKNFWHNIRFYFNPITSRLEPIAFDGIAGGSTTTMTGNLPAYGAPYIDTLFTDTIFRRIYHQELMRMSQPGYLDALLSAVQPEMNEQLAILKTEYASYAFNTDVLYDNQKVILKSLTPTKGLHAYFQGQNGRTIEVLAANAQAMPLEVTGVRYKGRMMKASNPSILPSKWAESPLSYQMLSFDIPLFMPIDEAIGNSLTLIYNVIGTKEELEELISPWSLPVLDTHALNATEQPEGNLDDFDFIVVDDSIKSVSLLPGDWQTTTTIIVPEGYRVIAGPGVHIDLLSGAAFVSRSPLEWIGEEADPILLVSSDHTGQGLFVLNAQRESVLEHVTFSDLTNLQQTGLTLTSAITFYDSPFKCIRCRFLRNYSEDFVNAIRSQFLIQDSLFMDTFSDAFDSDFADGKFANVQFNNCGNDCIDISGANVAVDNVRINGVGDKGISAGEKSVLTAKNVRIENGNIAFASKDFSELTITNSTASGCKIGLAVFQKKPEFGPAILSAANLTLEGIEKHYMLEEGSTISLDGAPLTPTHAPGEIYNILYAK